MSRFRTPQAVIFLITLFDLFSGRAPAAIDIGPMSWTPRSDWINVKNPAAIAALVGYKAAVGDGVADDTAAIQAIFNYIQNHNNGAYLTVYFPAGTYKITQTLRIDHVSGVSFIGCGSDTKISWAGAAGGAMYWPSASGNMRYLGLTWLGNNLAAAAYEECSYRFYSGGIRHENESFHDFTAKASYVYLDGKGQQIATPAPPAAAIISGYPAGLTGETQIFNCVFSNCGTGVVEAWNIGNFFCWFVEGCEFDHCGVGINLYTGGGNAIGSCHFDHCAVADILGGGDNHMRHCTSVGGAYFFADPGSDGNPLDANIIEDCQVDGWSNPAYAISFHRAGPSTVFDCTFTHPPARAASVITTATVDIESHLTLSNNYAPGFPREAPLIKADAKASTVQVPQGLRFGALTLAGASQTFVRTTFPAGGTHILDISQPPYLQSWSKPANQNGIPDITKALQDAVNDARAANNGSIVHIPTGLFNISSTIQIAGSNYTVEGNGFSTQLCWFGEKNAAMLAVESPRNLRVEFLRLTAQDNTVAAIRETSTTPSSVVFDGIHIGGFNLGNPGAGWNIGNPPGLVMSDLPAGSTVFIPHLDGPMTVQNCGPARIFCKYLANSGCITISGTAPKSGFLGALFTEGGGQVKGAYNVIVDDNQDLVFGDYYVEQCFNDVKLLRGKGTGTGRVTIQGFNTGSGNNAGGDQPPQYMVNVDNYAGRLFYGGGMMGDWNNKYPVWFNQTGSNPIDMILMGNSYSLGVTHTVGSSANLISTQNIDMNPYPGRDIADIPNPITASDALSIAQAFDHLRELEAVDLSMECGLMTDGPPIAQFPFEGNCLDMTGTYNGTAHDISYVAGLGSQAASFNGTSSYIEIPNPDVDNFSIAMWVRTTDTGGTGAESKVHGLVDGFAAGADFGISLANGHLTFGVGKPDSALTSKAAISDGVWHHLVATHDSKTGAMQIYVDGILDKSTTGPIGSDHAKGDLWVGAIKNAGRGSFLNGVIDQMQIFDYVLNANDVGVLCNRTKGSMP